MNHIIRPATTDDAQAIAEIYNMYIVRTAITFETTPVDADEMSRRIRDISSTGPYLVYCEDSMVKGYCYAHLWKERAAFAHTFEISVYLLPEMCGRGIGTMLLNRLIADCRERDIHVLVACITADNTASYRLHEKAGFVRVSHFHEVGRKFGRWYDVVDYQLTL